MAQVNRSFMQHPAYRLALLGVGLILALMASLFVPEANAGEKIGKFKPDRHSRGVATLDLGSAALGLAEVLEGRGNSEVTSEGDGSGGIHVGSGNDGPYAESHGNWNQRLKLKSNANGYNTGVAQQAAISIAGDAKTKVW